MIKTFELFAGFGGLSFGFKKAGIDYECVGYSEIDPYAIQCYEQNHGCNILNSETNIWKNSIKNYGDINKINPEELPDFDLLTGGFPCQSFSIAGDREGFEHEVKGKLFFEIIRIAKVKKPKYMILENVKGILNHDEGKTHARVLKELKQIGYGIAWRCLNSKDYNIPHKRKRVWYVCKLGGWDFMEFMFPNKEKQTLFLKDILESDVEEKYYLTEHQIEKIKERILESDVEEKYYLTEHQIEKIKERLQIRGRDYLKRINPKNAYCLTTKQQRHCPSECTIIVHSTQPRSGDPSKGGTGHLSSKDGNSYCLTTSVSQVLETKNNWRQFTPKECFRLMGFLDDKINIEGISDTQKYKLAGNGCDINVVSKILKEVFK